MTIDLNIAQLTAEITRAQSDEDASVGLSINRHVEDGMATWEIVLGVYHGMTVFDSQTDYRRIAVADIAAEIILDWDAEWDD